MFINTLPRQQALLPWLGALQAQQTELRQYEYSPLIQVQGWSDVPRNLPLFESIVVFENYPVSGAGLNQDGRPPIEIRDIQLVEQSNYPLTVLAVPGAALTLRINYNSQRFDSATIIRILGHLQTLLADIAAQPNRPLADLPLLTAAERAQLLVEWNDTRAHYPQDVGLHELIAAQVTCTPDAVAIVFDETTTDHRLSINGNASSFIVGHTAPQLRRAGGVRQSASPLSPGVRGRTRGPRRHRYGAQTRAGRWAAGPLPPGMSPRAVRRVLPPPL
jgi:non-ribosomal peptide synthetase component F